MESKHKLLETVVGPNVGELRDLAGRCLEAGKAEKDAAVRGHLLQRGLQLAQQAEAIERQTPPRSVPMVSGTPIPETG